MKKCLFILMVCLMATAGAYASRSWVGPTGSWGTATNWQSSTLPSDTDGELKIIKTSATSCNLDVDAGSFTATKLTISGNGGLTFNITSTGSIRSGAEFTVGCGIAGAGVPTGIVNQTGGTLTLNDTAGTGIGKLEIGYRSGSAGVGNGTYTISGGTINGSGGIYVGAMAGTTYAATSGGPSGSIGKLVVQGSASTISVGGPLFVGTGDPTGTFTGTGTLEFQIVNGGVSAIQTSGSGVYIDPTNELAAVANLIVSVTSGVPAPVILLVNNTGVGAVTGVFDSVTLTGLAGYTVDYQYDNSNGNLTGGNDIALIPEPVTIALLGLGFLAIRRKK